MERKVIQVSKESHEKLEAFCKKHGISYFYFASKVLSDAVDLQSIAKYTPIKCVMIKNIKL